MSTQEETPKPKDPNEAKLRAIVAVEREWFENPKNPLAQAFRYQNAVDKKVGDGEMSLLTFKQMLRDLKDEDARKEIEDEFNRVHFSY